MITTTAATLTPLDPALERPLSEAREFRRDTLAPRASRNFAAAFLAANGIDGEAIDTAQLLVTEVVTNAARYANRGHITVKITIGEKQIRFEVTDAGRSRADVALDSEFDETSESGRGWFLVTELAAECGIERISGGNGNRVFFVIGREAGDAR